MPSSAPRWADEQWFAAYGVDADVKTGLSAEELQAIIGAYEGLAIRSATKVTEAVLVAAHNLKVVARAGIGVDNVDIAAVTKRGVVVMNTPYGNAVTTAEHAIAMMLALARQIPQASHSTKAGKWVKSRFMGTELTGKCLGLVAVEIFARLSPTGRRGCVCWWSGMIPICPRRMQNGWALKKSFLMSC